MPSSGQAVAAYKILFTTPQIDTDRHLPTLQFARITRWIRAWHGAAVWLVYSSGWVRTSQRTLLVLARPIDKRCLVKQEWQYTVIRLRNVQLCNKVSQKITRFLWSPKVGYRVYNSPQLVTISSQINPVQAPFPIYLISILILCSHLSLCFPSLLVPSGFPTKILHTFYFVPSTCAAHLTLTISGDIYTPCCSSVCNCLQSPVISSLLAPNFSLSALFSNTISLYSSLCVTDQVSHPYKTRGRVI